MWTSLKNIFGIFPACAGWFEKAGISAEIADKLASYSAILLVLFVLTSVIGTILKFSKVVREASHPNPVAAVLSRIVLALGSMIGIPATAAIILGLKSKFSLILSFYTPFSEASQLETIINIVGIVAMLMVGILLFSFVSYLIHETQKLIERFKWWGVFEMLNACLYGFLIIILLASVLLSMFNLIELDYHPYLVCFIVCTVLYVLNEVSVQFDRRKRGRLGNKNSIGYLVEAGDKPETSEEDQEDGATKRIEVINPDITFPSESTVKKKKAAVSSISKKPEVKEAAAEVKETVEEIKEAVEEKTVEPEEVKTETSEAAEPEEKKETIETTEE